MDTVKHEPPPNTPGFVYFIEAVGLGHVKIGWAIDPQRRIRLLQTGSSLRLRLLLSIPGTREDEAKFHEKFRDIRFRGEWFFLTRAMRTWIGVSSEEFAAKADDAAENIREVRKAEVDRMSPVGWKLYKVPGKWESGETRPLLYMFSPFWRGYIVLTPKEFTSPKAITVEAVRKGAKLPSEFTKAWNKYFMNDLLGGVIEISRDEWKKIRYSPVVGEGS